MFKTKGGRGVKGFLNNVQKTADLVAVGTPYSGQTCTGKEATEGGGVLSLKKKELYVLGNLRPVFC